MKKDNGLIIFIVIIALIWGISSLYSSFKNKKESESVMQEHPNYSSYKETKDCGTLAPNNPYNEGSGHYAGFECGAGGNDCGGNSDSFIEGCEDYQTQESAYQTCLNK